MYIEPAQDDEDEEQRLGALQQRWKEEDGAPAHHHIDHHRKDGIAALGDGLEQYARKHHRPFDDEDDDAARPLDEAQADRGVAAGDRKQDGDVIELAEHIFLRRAIAHAVIDRGCQEHKKHAHQVDGSACGADHAALDIAVYREQGKDDEGDHGHHAVRDGVADFLPERKAEHLPHQFLCHGLPPLPIRPPAGILAYIIAQKGEMLAQLLSFPFRQSRRIPAYTMLKRKIMI